MNSYMIVRIQMCLCLQVENQTDTEEVESDDEMSEECFHCSQLIPLYQLRAHIQQCSARLVYKF